MADESEYGFASLEDLTDMHLKEIWALVASKESECRCAAAFWKKVHDMPKYEIATGRMLRMRMYARLIEEKIQASPK